MDTDSMVDGATRKRTPTACEACRTTKIKCQPSEQPGVCQKCLESKKECVSRTGPRIRRKRAQIIQDSLQPAPPAGPSTFSIDFAIPSQPEVDNNFETLKEVHANAMETLFPPEPNFDSFLGEGLPVEGFPTPPASSSQSHSIQELHAKPQFNIVSAESLLKSFRSMIPHFPCILLPGDASVQHLAATQPFVLLAILSAASGSRTLQGHSLYDEEFRKVLGLKFVAGGERSIELLRGLLIYCAWYPFHLRPRNKQALQYLRMAADLVNDLELDQDTRTGTAWNGTQLTDQQLDSIRVYLAYYYVASAFATTWSKFKTITVSFTAWTATCCDILEQNAQVHEDGVLVYMVRICNAVNNVSHALYESKDQTEQQSSLVLLGMEAQFRDIQQRIPSHVASTTTMKLATLFAGFCLDGGAVMKTPRVVYQRNTSLLPSASKLCGVVGMLKSFLDFVASLDQVEQVAFTGVEWARLVQAIILALRLSFPPVPECPEWDDAWARSQLRLDEFLARMSNETGLTAASKKVDVVSASGVVMGMVKENYDRRLTTLMTQDDTPGRSRCPMMDGSLEQYYPIWDADYGMNAMPQPTGPSAAAAQPVFYDLWATMTMGWANEDQDIS